MLLSHHPANNSDCSSAIPTWKSNIPHTSKIAFPWDSPFNPHRYQDPRSFQDEKVTDKKKSVLRYNIIIITARKRSLGQGNIFIGVCQEFCSQGGVCSRGRVCTRGHVCSVGHVCSWGVSAPRGLSAPEGCLLLGGVSSRRYLVETPLTDTPAGGTHPTGMHSC